MLIIPVIDLKNGQAVHAIGGNRDQYEPLSTHLCDSSDPLNVAQAYLEFHPFTTLYIADLDAIEKTGSHHVLVERLLQQFPELSVWLDAGFSQFNALEAWTHNPRLRPVLGSESQSQANLVRAILAQYAAQYPLLSLDYKNDRFLGPKELLDDPQNWPDEIILMQLDRVGADQGPNIDLPPKSASSGKRFYAAGGVRNKADLDQLAAAGYAGVLVASALHDGRLSKDDIAEFMKDEY